MILESHTSRKAKITQFARKLGEYLGLNRSRFHKFAFKGFIRFILNPLNLGFLLTNLEFSFHLIRKTLGLQLFQLFLSFLGFWTLRTRMILLLLMSLVLVDENVLLNPILIAFLVRIPSRILLTTLQKDKLIFLFLIVNRTQLRAILRPILLVGLPFRKRFATQLLVMRSILPTLGIGKRTLTHLPPFPSPTTLFAKSQLQKEMFAWLFRILKISPCLVRPRQIRIGCLKALKKTILLRLLHLTNLLLLTNHLRDLFLNLLFRVLRQKDREATNILQARGQGRTRHLLL